MKSEYIILIIVFIVFVLLFIGAILLLYFFNKQSGLNGSCSTDENCKSGLVCQSSVCKANTGSSCSVDSDCITGDTCQSGVCAVTPPVTLNTQFLTGGTNGTNVANGTNVPNPKINKSIVTLTKEKAEVSELSKGSTVTQTKKLDDNFNPTRTKIYENNRLIFQINEHVISVCTHQNELYLLLTNDQIVINDNFYTTNLMGVTEIFSISNILYGIYQAKLYQASINEENNTLIWSLTRWSPLNIKYYQVIDDSHLWIQTAYQLIQSNTDGYLYEYEIESGETNNIPITLDHVSIKANFIRIYNDINTYSEVENKNLNLSKYILKYD